MSGTDGCDGRAVVPTHGRDTYGPDIDNVFHVPSVTISLDSQ